MIFAMNSLFYRILIAALFGTWFVLLLLGKGGFIHIILLCGIAVLFLEIVWSYRTNVKE